MASDQQQTPDRDHEQDADDSFIPGSEDDTTDYGLDLYIDVWCKGCSTYASVDSVGIDGETGWRYQECDCGEVIVDWRVAPWPRHGMERIDGEWEWPDDEAMFQSLPTDTPPDHRDNNVEESDDGITNSEASE